MWFTIPDAELHFRASRGSGPGGQHVNKVSTRVEVRWNVMASPTLTDQQRQRLRAGLANRIDTAGWIRVSAGTRRSQMQNRDAAVGRLHELVNEALRPVKPRKETRTPRSAHEARLTQKKKRSQRKTDRKPVDPED